MMKFLFLIFCFSFPCFSQNVESISKEVLLEINSKQLAHEKAMMEISRDLVIEMIGEKRYQEDQKKIESHIIKNQNRYVLSIRSSSPSLQESGDFSSQVTVKISRENLKDLLLEHNLFYSSEGSFCLLPVISFSLHSPSEKKSYFWWKKDSLKEPLLEKMAQSFFELLSEELIKNGFYSLNPVFQRLREGSPSSILPKRGLRVKNFVPLAEFYVCDIILSGYVRTGVLDSKESFRWKNWFSSSDKSAEKKKELDSSPRFTHFFFNVFNIKTRQFLFKLEKRFPFSSAFQEDPQKEMVLRLRDVLDSLIYQLASYQEEGSLDMNRLTISIQGPLNYSQKEKLKKALVKKIPSIQSLEERLLSSSRIVYSAESSKDMKTIARQIKSTDFSDFIIQLKGYKKQEMEIYAKKREP